MTETQSKISRIELWLYQLVDAESDDKKVAQIFNYFIVSLIILSVVAMALETVDSIYQPYKTYFSAFEVFSIIIFTFEYVVRLITAGIDQKEPNKIKAALNYAKSFYGLVDLVSIIPFYLPMMGVDLRVVRTLRLLRFFRLFKIARYNDSLTLIKDVVRDKSSEILVSCFVILIAMVIASFLMYYAENEAQPEQFDNVFKCIWWTIVTLTTVGYGDTYPITFVGKLLGGTISFLGIGLVALPTGIISAGFLEKINKKAEEKEEKKQEEVHNHNCEKHYCPYCGHKLD